MCTWDGMLEIVVHCHIIHEHARSLRRRDLCARHRRIRIIRVYSAATVTGRNHSIPPLFSTPFPGPVLRDQPTRHGLWDMFSARGVHTFSRLLIRVINRLGQTDSIDILFAANAWRSFRMDDDERTAYSLSPRVDVQTKPSRKRRWQIHADPTLFGYRNVCGFAGLQYEIRVV